MQPPAEMSAFEFVVLSSLRAAQLTRGCIPRVDGGTHKIITTAQMEVATRKVRSVERTAVAVVIT